MPVSFASTWNYPNKIVTGAGCAAQIPALTAAAGIRKPLLVTDKGLAASPMMESIRNALVAAGLETALFSDVQGNPTDKNLADGIFAYRQNGCDGVVCVGGGSALDIGKCIAFMHGQNRPVWDFEDIGDRWTRANAGIISPIIAVPTTAGTGSEVGRAVVITDTGTQRKKIIFHPLMLPKVAVEDPELAAGLPQTLTIGTGFDALAHCFEAYCVDTFHPMADGIALEGMRLVKDFLPRAVANGNDMEARSCMFAAATMGGVAFQKGLGAIHSISHPVGARFHAHHGLLNGVIFPYVMLANKMAFKDKALRISTALSLQENSFEGLLEWVLDFRKQFSIPHSLGEIGVTEEAVNILADDAAQDPTAATNPRTLSVPEFRQLILATIRGDFTLVP